MPGNLSALPAPGLFQLITMRKSWTNTAQGFCEQGKVTTQNQDNKRTSCSGHLPEDQWNKPNSWKALDKGGDLPLLETDLIWGAC